MRQADNGNKLAKCVLLASHGHGGMPLAPRATAGMAPHSRPTMPAMHGLSDYWPGFSPRSKQRSKRAAASRRRAGHAPAPTLAPTDRQTVIVCGVIQSLLLARPERQPVPRNLSVCPPNSASPSPRTSSSAPCLSRQIVSRFL